MPTRTSAAVRRHLNLLSFVGPSINANQRATGESLYLENNRSKTQKRTGNRYLYLFIYNPLGLKKNESSAEVPKPTDAIPDSHVKMPGFNCENNP